MTNMGGLIHSRALSRRQRDRILQLHRDGEMKRISAGVFIPSSTWDCLGTPERLQALAAASTLTRESFAARSYAAAACHLFPVPPGATASFIEARYVPQAYPHRAVVTVNTCFGPARVLSPSATIADLATQGSVYDAVRAGDALVAGQADALETLRSGLESIQRIPGSLQARVAAGLLSEGIESPRESDLKIAMWLAELPAPLAQASIVDLEGRVLARPDFYFPHYRVAVEYDGMGKLEGAYGISTEEAVRRERLRERRLSNLGIRVIRFDKYTLADGSAMDALRQAINGTDASIQLASGLGRAVTASGRSSIREAQRFEVSGGFPTWTMAPTASALRAF